MTAFFFIFFDFSCLEFFGFHFQLKDTQLPPNINCVDSQGNSCLHCASYRGHKKCAVLLLQNGIDTNIRNTMGTNDERSLYMQLIS